MAKSKILVALDFDGTVVDCDSSEIEIFDYVLSKFSQYQQIKQRYFSSGRNWLLYWGDFVNENFALAHQMGVSQPDFERTFSMIQLTEGMQELFFFMNDHSDKYSTVIVSDCNSFFLNGILRNWKLMSDRIICCPTTVDFTGKCTVHPYHEWDHQCVHSTSNLCKNLALNELNVYSNWRNLYYIGDSTNDICAANYLRKSGDILFPRMNFPLHHALSNEKRTMKVIPWRSAFGILRYLKALL